MNDLSKIAKRHPRIPQDALPLDIPATPQGGDETVKNRAQKSIDWATCPHHKSDGLGHKGGMTGLIAVDNKTLAFRHHSKKVGKVTITCPGSGQVYVREGVSG